MQNPYSSSSPGRAIIIDRSVLSSTYGLLAIAMGITALGVYAGATFALPILASGWAYLLFVAELLLVIMARAWVRSSPLNYLLFFLFPFLSGLTVTPFLMAVATGYANGEAILLNAAIATALMTGAAAVVGRTTSINLGAFGGFLFMGIIGLLLIGIAQIFIPSLRTGTFEVLLSGAGVLIFAGFIVYDVQRVKQRAMHGESPFLLALSLYLDIFNLFIYVVRFMLATSGNRRNW